MAVRRIKNHGKWVWQARVAYRGSARPPSGRHARRRATPRPSCAASSRRAWPRPTRRAPGRRRSASSSRPTSRTSRPAGGAPTACGRAHSTLQAITAAAARAARQGQSSRIGDADVFAFRNAPRPRGQDGHGEASPATRHAARARQAEHRSTGTSARSAPRSRRRAPSTDSRRARSSRRTRPASAGSGRRRSCSCSSRCRRRSGRSPSSPR